MRNDIFRIEECNDLIICSTCSLFHQTGTYGIICIFKMCKYSRAQMQNSQKIAYWNHKNIIDKLLWFYAFDIFVTERIVQSFNRKNTSSSINDTSIRRQIDFIWTRETNRIDNDVSMETGLWFEKTSFSITK